MSVQIRQKKGPNRRVESQLLSCVIPVSSVYVSLFNNIYFFLQYLKHLLSKRPQFNSNSSEHTLSIVLSLGKLSLKVLRLSQKKKYDYLSTFNDTQTDMENRWVE